MLNIGTIHGGTKHNQVPDRCTVSLDIRLLPSQDPYDVKARVEAMIDELRQTVDPRIDAVVEFSEHWLSGPRHAYEIEPTPMSFARSTSAVRRSTGADAVYRGVPFWCDLVALREFGIPGVNFGPGDPPYNFADEYVFEEQYLQAVDVYEAMIREWCQCRWATSTSFTSVRCAPVADDGAARRGRAQGELDIVRDGAVAIRDGIIVGGRRPTVGARRAPGRCRRADDRRHRAHGAARTGRVPQPSDLRRRAARRVRRAARRREPRRSGRSRRRHLAQRRATRAAAGDDELLEHLDGAYRRILAGGVTTLEVKSGYGLTVERGAARVVAAASLAVLDADAAGDHVPRRPCRAARSRCATPNDAPMRTPS